MKDLKKAIALMIVLALALCLVGCTAFERKMVRAGEKMNALESFRCETELDFGVRMSILGQSQELDGKGSVYQDMIVDPMELYVDSFFEAMGEREQLLCYARQEGEQYLLTMSTDGGKSWESRSVELEELPGLDLSLEQLGWLRSAAESFTEDGEREVKGMTATLYTGLIRGEDIEKALALSGVVEQVGESLEVELRPEDLALSELEGIPTTIGIDKKSGMVCWCAMDLCGLLQTLVERVMAESMDDVAEDYGVEGLDLNALDFELTITRATVELSLYDFDAVDSIRPPAAA